MVSATRFKRWVEAGYTSELLPVIPVGAALTPTTKVRPEHVGKVPGVKTQAGTWSGLGGRWPDTLTATVEQCKEWHNWGANVGLQGRRYPGLDVDVNDEPLAFEISEIAKAYLGLGPIRSRAGSARRLHMFVTEEPMRKVRLAFKYQGEKQAVELLAHGQQYVVEGLHPGGKPYEVADMCRAADLPEISAADVQRFFDALVPLLLQYSCELETQRTAGDPGKRHTLDHPSLWAPSPADVLEVLRVWHPDELAHDDFVAAMAAIKAALGPTREEHYPEVLAWAPGARCDEDEATRKVWDSVVDAAVGWDWLASRANAGALAAQSDFADPPPEDAMDKESPDTEALVDMVEQYVYVRGLDRFVDLPTGELLTDKGFNSLNTLVAKFGLTGVNSASGIFHNRGDARKVATATYRPGQPHVVREEVSGTMRDAVNLWRPSLLRPAEGDVGPWISHMEAMFGPAGSDAFEHMADYMAFIVQFPGVKVNHAPVLLGPQGIGKDSVFEPLRRALGLHNAATIETERLAESFNSDWIQGQFVIVNEAHTFHRRETMNRLKPLLAAPPDTLTVNKKGVPQYAIPNIINVALFTNHEDALAPERSDRRFWVWRCLLEADPGEVYFDALWNRFYNVGGCERVFAWLLARDVTAFNPKKPAPMTEAKADMIEATTPAAVTWLEEQFEEGGIFVGRQLLTTREVSEAGNDFGAPGNMREPLIRAELKRRGFRTLEGKFKIDGKAVRLWARGRVGNTEHAFVLGRYEKERKAAA